MFNEGPYSADKPRVKAVLHLATFLWVAILITQIGTWSAAHAIPLQSAGLSVSLSPSPKWRAVHVLVDDCACSRAVAEHLAHRGPQPGWVEEVWILNSAGHLAVPGLPTTLLTPARAQAAGITGGPRLLLFNPDGTLAWSGGYSPRKPRGTANLADLSVMRAVSIGQLPAPVPVFGCPRVNPNLSEL
jgi:hypothetical protein